MILKFPQIILIILFPKLGMAEIKFVITIIAQYDIWFHTNEYPINDSIIVSNNITIPVIHIFIIINDLNIILRVICRKIIMKIIDVMFLCINRIIHP